MSYLLDTNSWVDHLRHGPISKVTGKLLTVPQDEVYLCSIVVGELVYGAHHGGAKNQSSNFALIAALRQQFTSLPFDDAAADEYGKIRAHLRSLGTPIGPNDLLIAAIALTNGLTLVTHNLTEFNRVPGLRTEDWQ